VRAVFGRYDELAIGKERVVLAMWVDEDAWKRAESIERCPVAGKLENNDKTPQSHSPATRMSTLLESVEYSLVASHRYRPESSWLASLMMRRLSSENVRYVIAS